jgi:ribosomal protein S18 acetylase RimI-like enzyme
MNLSIRQLTESDMPEVRRLYLDGFSDSAYYTAVEPDASKRTAMFDKEVMPQALCCVKAGTSYGCESGGVLCAMLLVVVFIKEHTNEYDKMFFDFYSRIGDKDTLAGREALLKTAAAHGRAAYFFSAAVDKRFRRKHIGITLIKHCLAQFPGMPVVTELTTPEMLSLFDSVAEERKLIQNRLSDHYVITTIEP